MLPLRAWFRSVFDLYCASRRVTGLLCQLLVWCCCILLLLYEDMLDCAVKNKRGVHCYLSKQGYTTKSGVGWASVIKSFLASQLQIKPQDVSRYMEHWKGTALFVSMFGDGSVFAGADWSKVSTALNVMSTSTNPLQNAKMGYLCRRSRPM